MDELDTVTPDTRDTHYWIGKGLKETQTGHPYTVAFCYEHPDGDCVRLEPDGTGYQTHHFTVAELEDRRKRGEFY